MLDYELSSGNIFRFFSSFEVLDFDPILSGVHCIMSDVHCIFAYSLKLKTCNCEVDESHDNGTINRNEVVKPCWNTEEKQLFKDYVQNIEFLITLVYTNIDQTLVNSLHRLLNCKQTLTRQS